MDVDMVSKLLRQYYQVQCKTVREWVRHGVAFAYLSKCIESAMSDLIELSNEDDEAKKAQIVAKYSDMNIAIDELLRQQEKTLVEIADIEKLVFEGRTIDVNDPAALPYEPNDIPAFMRVFSQWLAKYMETE